MATVEKQTKVVTSQTTSGSGTSTTTTHATTGARTINSSYLTSLPGILKIIEFFTLVVAFASLADCCHAYLARGRHKYIDYYKVFIGLTVSAWLLVIIIFLVFFIGAANRLSKGCAMMVMIFNILYAISIFVASAMVTDFAHLVRGAKGSTFYDTLIVAVVFGFISSALLLLDAFVHFKATRK